MQADRRKRPAPAIRKAPKGHQRATKNQRPVQKLPQGMGIVPWGGPKSFRFVPSPSPQAPLWSPTKSSGFVKGYSRRSLPHRSAALFSCIHRYPLMLQQPTVCCAFTPACQGYCRVFVDAQPLAWLNDIGQLSQLGFWMNMTTQQLNQAASRLGISPESIPKALRDMAILVQFDVNPSCVPFSLHHSVSWFNV